jgi:hypothetical protein
VRIADDEQPRAKGVRNRLRADRLAGAGQPGEIERERETGGMSFAKTPAVEHEVVLRHVHERLLE